MRHRTSTKKNPLNFDAAVLEIAYEAIDPKIRQIRVPTVAATILLRKNLPIPAYCDN
ncbi:hypothetical protein D3C77_404950 [compost metagenome]